MNKSPSMWPSSYPWAKEAAKELFRKLKSKNLTFQENTEEQFIEFVGELVSRHAYQTGLPAPVVVTPSDGWALRAAKRILNSVMLVAGSEDRMASTILHEYDKHRRSLPSRQNYDSTSKEPTE